MCQELLEKMRLICNYAINLFIQIITGVFSAMHYTPHMDLAFLSVEHIMRDVKGSWLLCYMGQVCFFIVVYLHIFHGL